jgi:C4-dicarboxylate-specific signal transduction histidine kinase
MDAMTTIPYFRTVIGRTEPNGGSSAVISISDSGPGIPPDKLAQAFDPFFTTKDQGMGIGLSIARTIILAHQGRSGPRTRAAAAQPFISRCRWSHRRRDCRAAFTSTTTMHPSAPRSSGG